MSDALFVLTGGCGFLGQHLTPVPLEAFPEARFAGHRRVDVQAGVDVTDAHALRGRLDGAAAVVHLAGIVAFGLKDRARLEKAWGVRAANFGKRITRAASSLGRYGLHGTPFPLVVPDPDPGAGKRRRSEALKRVQDDRGREFPSRP